MDVHVDRFLYAFVGVQGIIDYELKVDDDDEVAVG